MGRITRHRHPQSPQPARGVSNESAGRPPLTYTQVGILLRGDADGLGEGLEEITVVGETAAFIGFIDADPLIEQRLCNADSAGGNILIDGGAGGSLENTTDIGLTEIEMLSQLFYGNGVGDVLVNVGQNIIHLMVIFIGRYRGFGFINTGQAVDECQQFHESSLLYDIMGKAFGRSDFIDKVEKALLLFFIE